MRNKEMKFLTLCALLFLCVTVMVACGECEHIYKDGVCTKCSEAEPGYEAPCEHNYANGVCTVCGEEDPTYIPPCAHTYVNGACAKCGDACKHSYTDGVCDVCGYEDPDYIPADGGESMYAEIVEKFKYLVLYKYMNEDLPPKSGKEPFYTDALYEVVGEFTPTMELGYAYKDIDGDGYVELVLTEGGVRLYAMFTIKDKSPAIVATFQKGMGYLDEGGMVFYNTKKFDEDGGQIFLGNNMKHLSCGELVGITYGWEDSDGNFATQDDDTYYYISEDGTKSQLTYDEYKFYRDKYKYYWEYPTRLTKLSNLKSTPALVGSGIPEITADFSTYDAIINTFGLMHSAVTDGKCVRSKWSSGAYDNGMIFESYADFVLYNQIFAACVLVQNSSTATFGYAKADLNGDGTEELILLDSKYNVLAIFTERDGKAVLLDSYNDRRTAFIDAKGLIHVKERIIPGSEEDFEYFVYEVGAGELICKVALGIKRSSQGAQTEIYKIVNGVKTNVEQSEWDALYAEYVIDLGNVEFKTYTKEKAGLVFVAIPEK